MRRSSNARPWSAAGASAASPPAPPASPGCNKLLASKASSAATNRVVCILTGHELKDPTATVKYHTGIKTKDAKQPPAEPTWGSRANKPIQVADDMPSIIKALGMASDTLEKSVPTGYIETPSSTLPFVEY